MQKFSKKQIALAVSASLLAGTAGAAALSFTQTEDGTTGSKSAIAVSSAGNGAGAAQAGNRDFYTTGKADTLTVSIRIPGAVGTGGALTINAGTAAASDFYVYADNAGTKLPLVVSNPIYVPVVANDDPATDVSVISFDLDTIVADTNAAFKVKAGKLYYIPDTTATTPAEYQVKYDVNVVSGDALTQDTNNGGSAAGAAAIDSATTGKEIFSGILPSAQASTIAASNLINGVVIDTFAAVTALAKDTDVDFKSGSLSIGAPVDLNAAVTAGSASGNKYPFTFATPKAVDWNGSGGTADKTDEDLYVAKNFHTGVTGTFAIALDGAATAKYSEVFNVATGKADIGVALDTTIVDGVKPVLLGADADAQTLSLTFSEPIAFRNGGSAEDIREILESVSVGAAGNEILLAPQFVNASLTADAGISSGDAKALYGVDVASDTLNITALDPSANPANLPFDAVGKSVKISLGLGANEIDGLGEVAGTKLDDAGVVAQTGATDLLKIADAVAVSAIAKEVTVDFDSSNGVPHKAIGISGSAGYVEKIQVTLRDADRNALDLKLKTGLTNLDGKFLIELTTLEDLENGSGKTFKWFPSGANQINLIDLSKGKITFTLPKELLLANLDTATVSFLDTKPATDDDAGGPLASTVDGDATGELIATVKSKETNVLPGTIEVDLPLYLAGANYSNLYSQRISQKVTGDDTVALEDTLVKAYLAKWQDKAVAGATTVAINSGKVSIPGDKWATEVALDLSATVGGNKQSNAKSAASASLAEADVHSVTIGDQFANASQVADVAADIASEYAAARQAGASVGVAKTRAISFASGNLGAAFTGGDATGTSNALTAAANAASVAYEAGTGSTASLNSLVSAINDQLAEAKPAAVPAWVVVTRSNDLVKGGNNTGSANSENYVEARAALFGTQAAAVAAAGPQSTVFEVAVDPKTGKISGRLTGELKLKATTATTAKRGLVFIGRDGSLVDSASSVQTFSTLVKDGRIDTLVGVDAAKVPTDKDLAALLKDAFVLLVHEDKDGNTKLITSAETGASNFLPFAANLLNKDGLGQIQGTATDAILNISKVGSASVSGSGSWQLVGLNGLSRAKGAKTALSLPRTLVGLSSGVPTSIWSNDSAHKDLALTMLGNSVGTAVESKDKDVESVNLGSNASAEGFAFAFNNDGAGTYVYVANAAAADVKLKAGWNLVSLPKAISTSALPPGVTMLLTSDLKGSWVKANASGAADANFNLSAGAPVFVYLKDAKAGDTLFK